MRVEGDRLVAAEVPKVYCPACRQDIEVPEGARPWDTLTCCGRTYRLSYEFGAWALLEESSDGGA